MADDRDDKEFYILIFSPYNQQNGQKDEKIRNN